MKKLTTSEREDRDETRRLLYMAKCVPLTEHWELAGTLINAMRHHLGNDDPELEDKIIGALRGPDSLTASWLSGEITKLS